jgi:hypothetical protein
MNKLKLYLAAHDAAAKALDLKSKTELDAAKAKAFTDAGFTSKQDFGVFSAYFDDEQLKMKSIAAQKLPSELAAETM